MERVHLQPFLSCRSVVTTLMSPLKLAVGGKCWPSTSLLPRPQDQVSFPNPLSTKLVGTSLRD